jgi:pyruvate carboxylase subunit B
MELIVRHGGEDTPVKLRREGERFAVEIGDRTYLVDREAANGSIRSFLIDGAQYELAVRPDGERRYQVSGAGGMEEVEVLDPLTLLAEESHAQGRGGAARVDAYMPGRVVTLLVAEGDRVEAGQGVVVLEAMKMENEIEAEADGVVTRLFVEEGQAVEGGDPLFEIGE